MLNSVKIPVHLGYQILGIVRVYGGPSVSWVTSVSDNKHGVTQDDYRSTLWGARLGAGVNILMLTVDFNYEWGLTKTFKEFSGQEPNAKMNVATLTAGLKF